MDFGFDVTGDVHVHAVRLEALLENVGYVKRGGTWHHSDRKAVFVGDLVDRGPEYLRTCRIAMAMMESRSALAVMGNHDFTAVWSRSRGRIGTWDQLTGATAE